MGCKLCGSFQFHLETTTLPLLSCWPWLVSSGCLRAEDLAERIVWFWRRWAVLETQGGVHQNAQSQVLACLSWGLENGFLSWNSKFCRQMFQRKSVTAQKKKKSETQQGVFKCRAGGRPGCMKTQKGPAPERVGVWTGLAFPRAAWSVCCKSVIVPALQRRQSTSRNISSELLCLCREKSLQGCTIYNCST